MVPFRSETWHKQTFEIIPQAHSIKQHERDEVGMRELLEFIVELDSIMHIRRPQEWESLEAVVQDALEGRPRHLSTSILPALEDFAVELLYLAKAKKNVLRGDRIREGAVATVVNKQDGKLGDALGATMVVGRGQASDIEQSNPTRLSEAFFVARAGRFDEPPHKWHLGTTVLRATRTVRGIERDMAMT